MSAVVRGLPARIGIMGGTFDPIHVGHLAVAQQVQHACNLDLILFVPTGQPWQKTERVVSPAQLRYHMTVLATRANPKFAVSRVDIERPGPTYTIDTLRDLHRDYPLAELFFITGADALAHIFSWKDVPELFDLATFIGVTRAGHALQRQGLPEGKVILLDLPGLDISSTDCRARIGAGQSITELVPQNVAQFIAETGLYLKSKAADGP